MKYILIIFILFSLYNCSNIEEGETTYLPLAKMIGLKHTENEEKGIKDLLNYFDGYCKSAVGKRTSNNEETSTYFELEFTESNTLEEFKNSTVNISSSLAYIFFSHLKQEREKYDEIIVVIKYIDGSENEEIFKLSELKIVEDRMGDVKNVVKYIKEKKYDSIRFMLKDTNNIPYEVNDIIDGLNNIEPELGSVVKFNLLGYRFYSTDNLSKILHISGSVERTKKSHQISFDFDTNSPQGEILMVNYKL